MAQKYELSPRKPRFSYPSMDSFTQAVDAKSNFQYDQHELYPRDGFPSLAGVEKQVAQLIGIEDGHALLTTSGMSAIVTAIEIAHPTAGDVILHGFESYSKSGEYVVEDLAPRGIKPVAVSIKDLDGIDNALKLHRPNIVFFETISNGAEMEVLDVKELLALPILREVDPLIILDNTLPTNSHLPLANLMKESGLRIIGVESGTKSYAMNQDLAGIVYTYNDELLDKLHRKRRRGDSPGSSLVETLAGVIPPTKEQFDRENRLIAQNTALLARAAFEVAHPDQLFITHHNLPNHSQHDLAGRLYPDGASSVFFISPINEGFEVEEIAGAIVDSFDLHGLEVGKDFYIAQSFGFNKTGISFVPGGYVRIAGGLENSEQLAVVEEALAEGLQDVLKVHKVKQNGLGFGPNNEFIVISRPGKLDDCAQESLSRLGYKGYEIASSGELVGPWEIELGVAGAIEVTKKISREGYDPTKAYMVLGEKSSNGVNHWFLRIGDYVINPEKGEPELAKNYQRKEIKEIAAVYEIPPGPLL